MSEDWTREEVELLVTEYFEMLAKEQAGIAYNKAETRRRILPLLKNRTDGSLEFKNRNISAVLHKIGQPYINGYVPASNYQKILLEDVVFSHILQKPEVENIFKLFAETVPTPKSLIFESMVEEMPTKETLLHEPELVYRSPVKVNYIEIEQANQAIGKTGENIALEYERWRLIQQGKENLADKIEWVSQTQGDGLGFDILSKNTNGTDRYIEVKATKLTKEAPFYFSALEYDFSKRNSSNFFLYRVFNLKADPKLFIANGQYDTFCNTRPTQFKASF
ncbi:MAG: DUF3883 domain-containing protein [Cyclobacteriaceae bacterium]|nr:DUF3883 domain-containing protein [Cyclobacteriaceae bacterium]